jgi:hypothetical protein
MIDQIKQALSNAMGMLFNSVAESFPTFILVVILLLVGWLIAKVAKTAIIKALTLAQIDKLFEKMEISPVLNRIGIKDPIIFLGTLVYWMIMLVFFIAIAEVIAMPVISNGIAAIIAYLPKILSALVILVMGMLLANGLKSAVQTSCESIGLSGARVISNIVYYVIFIFVAITAINQTGIDTSLITSNVTLIFGAMLLAFGISYGFASRSIMSNMLSSFYKRDKFKTGMRIRVDGVEGIVKEMDSLSVTLDCGDKTVVLPTQVLVEKKVEILPQEQKN